MARKPKQKKQVKALTHEEAKRKNIPIAEYQSMVDEETQKPKEVRYPRGGSGLEEEKANRNPDLDPQRVWRGKVQCIYLDPPYGIKFSSNFQWSTTSRDVKDGKAKLLEIFTLFTVFRGKNIQSASHMG